MSCTVVSIPIALAYILAGVVASASNYYETISEVDENTNKNNLCDEVHVIDEVNILEKEFETPFVDKNILFKTLEEHGAKNIVEEYGQIKAEVESYALTFEKRNSDEPYSLKISYCTGNNPVEKMNDLASEYTLNVQEESYLSIVDKLKENNMQVESEEVLEDNTIVLTINLEN